MGAVIRLFALLFLFLVPAVSSGQDVDLVGEDPGRENGFSRSFNNQGFIGKIECEARIGKIVTTAILINDRRTVLTVAHFNFDDQDNLSIEIDHCRFRITSKTNGKRFESRIELIASGGDHSLNLLTRSTDWALIQLVSPAPLSAIPIETGPGFSGNEAVKVSFVGFSMDHKDLSQPMIHSDCLAEPVEHRFMLIAHDCKTAPGSSGGAIVANFNGKQTLMAMHAGRTRYGGIAVRIGGNLGRIIKEHAAKESAN